MARKLERRWRDLRQKAKQLDDFDRTGALASAVSAIEVALTAAGTPRQDREGVQARLRRYTALANRTSVPEQINIMAAIDARNKAIHDHVVPSPDDCERHLLVLHKVWRELRRSFVTRQQAAALAASILQSEGISAVFLFGSLARGKRDPRDIDLLVLDKGQFSYL